MCPSHHSSVTSGLLTDDIADELQTVLDETSELVCLTDAFGRFTYVNTAWQRTLGYTAAHGQEPRGAGVYWGTVVLS